MTFYYTCIDELNNMLIMLYPSLIFMLLFVPKNVVLKLINWIIELLKLLNVVLF